MDRALYEIELAGISRKLTWAAACLVLAAMNSFFALRAFRAHRAAESLTREGLQRAIAVEPGNASHYSRLGRYKFFIEQDIPGSVPLYEAATKLNPHSARYWLDLAGAYAVVGKSKEQAQALQAAVAADPKSPTVAWEAGNFYLVRGDLPAAMQNLRVVSEGDPLMRLQALRLTWRSFHDASLLMDKVVPPDPAAYWDLLRVITESGELAPAKTVWNGIVKLNRPFLAKEAFPWVDALLKSGDSVQAQEVWHTLVKFDPAFASYVPDAGNLVVNSGFEEDLLNAGFDWRHDPQGGVEVAVDRDTFHFGTRSIRIDYQGRATSQSGPRQLIAVKPGHEYELSGFLKAEHLQTAVGASLVVRDASTGTVLARSAPIDSSTGWVQRSAMFKTDPGVSTVEIGVGRAYETNTLIKGTLWLDDVELTSR
jgi:tetratricopeptide (TPR) repeat protein